MRLQLRVCNNALLRLAVDMEKYWLKDSIERRIDKAISYRRRERIRKAISEAQEKLDGRPSSSERNRRYEEYEELEMARMVEDEIDPLELIALEIGRRNGTQEE